MFNGMAVEAAPLPLAIGGSAAVLASLTPLASAEGLVPSTVELGLLNTNAPEFHAGGLDSS